MGVSLIQMTSSTPILVFPHQGGRGDYFRPSTQPYSTNPNSSFIPEEPGTETKSYSGLGTWCDRTISFRCFADSSIAKHTSSVASPHRPS